MMARRGRTISMNVSTMPLTPGADVFVSLHMNSATETAHGAEVWYPNGSSYKRDEVSMGVTLSANILNRLQALGLYSRGAKTRDYPEGYDSSVYPDGSTSDYYGIIRYARQRGILGIIVEHAFITNDADAAFLSNEANLKALGEADAEGIARTYGLRTNGSWQWSDGCWHYYVGSTQLTAGSGSPALATTPTRPATSKDPAGSLWTATGIGLTRAAPT